MACPTESDPADSRVEVDVAYLYALRAEAEQLHALLAAAPSAERLRETVRWLDLIDRFASLHGAMFDARDDMQRDLTALADALQAVRGDGAR